jgi:hypothetical protein
MADGALDLIAAAAEKAAQKLGLANGAAEKFFLAATGGASKTTKEMEALNAAVTRVQQTQEKATEIFQRGVGGGELAEKYKKAKEGIKLFGDETISATDRTMALAGAVGIGARILGGYVGTAIQMAHAVRDASVAVQTERDEITQLRGSYEGLRAATLGVLSTHDALALRHTVQSANLRLTASQMATVAAEARNLAREEGTTLAEATTVVTGALTGNADAAAHLGVSSLRAGDAIRQMAAHQREGGNAALSAAEQAAIADRGWATLGRTVLDGVGGIGLLGQGYNWLGQQIEGVGSTRRRFASEEERDDAMRLIRLQQQREHNQELERARQAYAGATAEAVRLATAVKDAAHAGDDLTRALLPGENLADRLGTLRSRIAAHDMARGQRDELARMARREGTMSNADINRELGISGGQDNSEIQRALLAQQRLALIEEGTNTHLVQLQRQRHETTQHFLQAELEAQTAANAARRTLREAEAADIARLQTREQESFNSGMAIDAARKGAQNAEQERLRLLTNERIAGYDREMEAYRHSINVQIQLSEQWRANLHLQETSAQRFAGFTTGMFNSITAAAEQHFTALIEGSESGIQAVTAFVHTIGIQLALQASKEALIELGKGLSMLGRAAGSEGADVGAESSAAFHFAAFAAYVALAGAGVGAAAATNPQKPAAATLGGGGGGGGAATAARAGGGADHSGPGMNLTFNNYGIYDSKGARAMVADQMDDMARNNAQPVSVRQLRVRNTGRSGRH